MTEQHPVSLSPGDAPGADPANAALNPYEVPVAGRASLSAAQTGSLGSLTIEGPSAPSELDSGAPERFAKHLGLADHLASVSADRVSEARGHLASVQSVGSQSEVVGMEPSVKTIGEVVSRLETDHFVQQIPPFEEQVRDTTRTTPFAYLKPRSGRDAPEPDVEGVATEYEGLQDLYEFLHSIAELDSVGSRRSRVENGSRARTAQSLLETTSFVGEPEYKEAAAVTGVRWKQYLDEDPKHKLCILTGVGALERYQGVRKSDDHLRDQILSTFTDDELERYSGRIVADITQMDVDPDHGKLVMLDDWSLSGKQMRDVYHSLDRFKTFRSYVDAGEVEINLLIASNDRLKNGFKVNPYNAHSPTLPVYAYYRSHQASTAKQENGGHVSGLHSSANYDFAMALKKIARKQEHGFVPPMLARINSSYHFAEPQVRISADALTRVNAGGEA
jgi:hypothetical protein